MTEKPRFKRAFTDEDIVDMLASVFDAEAHEIRRCYELLAEAERMAELYGDEKQYEFDGGVVAYDHGSEAREFLKRLSK